MPNLDSRVSRLESASLNTDEKFVWKDAEEPAEQALQRAGLTGFNGNVTFVSWHPAEEN